MRMMTMSDFSIKFSVVSWFSPNIAIDFYEKQILYNLMITNKHTHTRALFDVQNVYNHRYIEYRMYVYVHVCNCQS